MYVCIYVSQKVAATPRRTPAPAPVPTPIPRSSPLKPLYTSISDPPLNTSTSNNPSNPSNPNNLSRGGSGSQGKRGELLGFSPTPATFKARAFLENRQPFPNPRDPNNVNNLTQQSLNMTTHPMVLNMTQTPTPATTTTAPTAAAMEMPSTAAVNNALLTTRGILAQSAEDRLLEERRALEKREQELKELRNRERRDRQIDREVFTYIESKEKELDAYKVNINHAQSSSSHNAHNTSILLQTGGRSLRGINAGVGALGKNLLYMYICIYIVSPLCISPSLVNLYRYVYDTYK